jgi:hypothetical protein
MEAIVKERTMSLEEMLNHMPPNPDAELDAHCENVIKPFLKEVLDYCRAYKAEHGYQPMGGCCNDCKAIAWPSGDHGRTAAGVILSMLGMSHLC